MGWCGLPFLSRNVSHCNFSWSETKLELSGSWQEMKEDWEVCSPFPQQIITSDKTMAWEEARLGSVFYDLFSSPEKNCRYTCQKLGRSHLWYPNSAEEANAFNTYFWSKSWPRQECYNFWSPVKLLEGEYVNIYSQTVPSYLKWYPGMSHISL